MAQTADLKVGELDRFPFSWKCSSKSTNDDDDDADDDDADDDGDDDDDGCGSILNRPQFFRWLVQTPSHPHPTWTHPSSDPTEHVK